MRWGSPLTFPNREVKPNCADGTAVMWESMSPPSFIKRLSEKIASFFVIGAANVYQIYLMKTKALVGEVASFFLKITLKKI